MFQKSDEEERVCDELNETKRQETNMHHTIRHGRNEMRNMKFS